jgi:2-iminobutanoate/2-iminopropanoate deaminase
MSLPIHHMISSGPRPVAPFSHAVEADGWVFVTGQMPTDPNAPDAPLPEGIEAQTARVMENLKIVLSGLSLGWENVTFARVYITEFERDYAKMNAVYQSYFEPGKLPGRTCIGVTGLAVKALVEIDLVVRRP